MYVKYLTAVLLVATICSAQTPGNPIIDGSTVPIPPPSSVKPDADVTTTDVPTSSTVAPTTTVSPNTNSTTVTTSTTTSTVKPTPSTVKPSTSAVPPTSSTHTPDLTTPSSVPSKTDKSFSFASFAGGVIFSTGLMAIGFVAFKFYKARTERNYHTL